MQSVHYYLNFRLSQVYNAQELTFQCDATRARASRHHTVVQRCKKFQCACSQPVGAHLAPHSVVHNAVFVAYADGS